VSEIGAEGSKVILRTCMLPIAPVGTARQGPNERSREQELVLENRRVTIPTIMRCVGVVHRIVEKLHMKNWGTCRARFVPQWNVPTRARRAKYSAVLRECADKY
jgi:hypothetical protein